MYSLSEFGEAMSHTHDGTMSGASVNLHAWKAQIICYIQ